MGDGLVEEGMQGVEADSALAVACWSCIATWMYEHGVKLEDGVCVGKGRGGTMAG